MRIIAILFWMINIQLQAQNVGIGTTTPNADLEISGDNNSAALFWDDGKASLRHHYNALTWERSIFNMFLDANNDQTGASFSIFTNSFTDTGLPKLKFDLEQGDSWISTQKLAINHSTPSNTLDVNGTIKVGTEVLTNPTAGTIRFENGVFEGFNGEVWLPLSSTPMWGEQIETVFESSVFEGGLTTNALSTDIELTEDRCFVRNEIAGEIWVLEKSGAKWDTTSILSSSFPLFGWHMGADGDDLVVGNKSAGISNPDTLEYLRFDGTDWINIQEIPLEYPLITYHSGIIDISNNRLCVGGAIDLIMYTKENGLWVVDTIFEGNFITGYVAGQSHVELDQDRAAASIQNSLDTVYSGVLLLENVNDEWIVMDTIHGSTSNFYFGQAIGLSGDNLIITERASSGYENDNIEVHYYHYDGNSWEYKNTVSTQDTINEGFGNDIAIYDNTVVIGSTPIISGPNYDAHFYRYEVEDGILKFKSRITTSGAIEIDSGSFPDLQFGDRVELNSSTIVTINPGGIPAGVYFYEKK